MTRRVVSIVMLLLGLCLPALAVPPIASDDSELLEMYQRDQADRQFMTTHRPGEWKPDEMEAMTRRDAERRARITELLRMGRVQTALDFYHAAMIYQHGSSAQDFLYAHLLSTLAAAKGHEPSRWLAAASLDRYLQAVKQPQIFGTQYRKAPPDQVWTMDPFDRSLPDALRREYGVPSLEKSLELLDDLRRDKPLVR